MVQTSILRLRRHFDPGLFAVLRFWQLSLVLGSGAFHYVGGRLAGESVAGQHAGGFRWSARVVWLVDFLARLLGGVRLFGLSAYMFKPEIPLLIRGLSLFHLWLPPLLFWLVWRSAMIRAPGSSNACGLARTAGLLPRHRSQGKHQLGLRAGA